MRCVYLVVCVLRIIKNLRGINLHHEVENVCLLGILMLKKVGKSMIWNRVRFLCLGMSSFMKMNFLLPLILMIISLIRLLKKVMRIILG